MTTKQRLIDATRELMKRYPREHDRISVRLITGKAGVNVAAVNYHFGCKAKLMEAAGKQ